MLNRTYDSQICSIARALEVVGERWSLLIVRDASFGLRRFHQFQQSLGIARNILSDRLNRLVDNGVLERVPAGDHADRLEYQLTSMGRELAPALIALMHWGDRYFAEHGPPRIAEHAGCGGELVEQLVCSRCAAMVPSHQVQTRPGPGLRSPHQADSGGTPTRRSVVQVELDREPARPAGPPTMPPMTGSGMSS